MQYVALCLDRSTTLKVQTGSLHRGVQPAHQSWHYLHVARKAWQTASVCPSAAPIYTINRYEFLVVTSGRYGSTVTIVLRIIIIIVEVFFSTLYVLFAHHITVLAGSPLVR
jgi:hypothetical protein